MTSNQPFVLPEGYLNAWTDSQQNETQPGSRVTASGFTSTVLPSRPAQAPQDKISYPGDQVMDNLDQYGRQRRSQGESKKSGKKSRTTQEYLNQLRSVNEDLLRTTEELVTDISRKQSKPANPPGFYTIPNTQLSDSPFNDKYRTMSDFEQFAADMSVHPDDSASQFNPLKLTKKVRQLEVVAEVNSEIPTMSVIGGFKQDVEQKIRELEAYKNVEPIAGLPIIFTNPRLNFLTHIHSALFKIISTDSGDYPAINCSELLLADRKNWSRDPSTKLLETVLDATIDSRDGEVIANPFNIPILEPTMKLTQKLVYMAFDQLHNEFETEWFNTMKSVTTPRFHSKYETQKYRRRNSSDTSGHSTRRVSSSSSNSNRQNKRENHGKSVVSSLFNFD